LNSTKAVFLLEDIEHCYNRHPSLLVERMSISPGSITGLIGPNGSGKSTLLKVMACIEKPTSGRIFFRGNPVTAFSMAVRLRTSLLTQDPYLLKRSVFENVAYGLRIRGDLKKLTRKVNQALARVGLPPELFSKRRWNELSGGEAQRVALAARLVLQPEVLFLDEPTASVDAASAQLIKEASLRARKELGTTLVIASHDWQWLYEICDRVLHMFDGKIYRTGMENIIFGPWVQHPHGGWCKATGDDQLLGVSAPPAQNAVAVIPAKALRLDSQERQAGRSGRSLKATVSRMILEKSSGDIVSTLMVGNIPFTIKLGWQEVRDLSLHPGKTVYITYDINELKWSR